MYMGKGIGAGKALTSWHNGFTPPADAPTTITRHVGLIDIYISWEPRRRYRVFTPWPIGFFGLMLRYQKTKGINTLCYAIRVLICCMGLPLQATSIVPAQVTQAKEQGNAPVSSGGRLGRITAYWAGPGDYYTSRLISATGVSLHDGHCAVDPSIIPYGSMVDVAGVGKFLAVDTGSAVVSRKAARQDAHTIEERKALVIDLFFKSRKAGEAFTASTPKYAFISWQPSSLPSTLLPTPVITPISMMLRLSPGIHLRRSPDEIASLSMPLRLGLPAHPLRPQLEVASQ